MKNVITTIFGEDLVAAFGRLDQHLGNGAYKKILGGKGSSLNLTDIVPAYLPDILNKVFGPLGIGWHFKLQSIETRETQGRSGVEFESKVVIQTRYAYLLNDALSWSRPIEMPGASRNAPVNWAEKGAISNALGNAWYMHGYQMSVYKDERGHDTPSEEIGHGENFRLSQPAQSVLNFIKSAKDKASLDTVKATILSPSSRIPDTEAKMLLNSIAEKLSDLAKE